MSVSEHNRKLWNALHDHKHDRAASYIAKGECDPHDDYLLITAIRESYDQESIQLLLDAGWNPNACEPQFQHSVLMKAAAAGMPAVVQKLLACNAELSAVDEHGCNAAIHACHEKSKGNIACLKILIEAGIDVNEGRFLSALMWAVTDGNEEMVEVLLKAGADPNRFYPRGNALYKAIQDNRPKPIPLLLKYGADPLAVVPTPWFESQFAGLTLMEFAKAMKRTKLIPLLEGKSVSVATANSAKAILLPALWKKLEKDLRNQDADPKEVLNPGASEKALQELEKELGVALPNSIKKSWSIHDGQPSEVACFRLCGDEIDELAGEADLYRMIPILEMLAERKLAAESYAFAANEPGRYQAESGIEPTAWASSWLPLMRNLCGNILCCDLAPPPEGIIGQIVLVSSENRVRKRVANDWCECLEDLTIGLGDED